MLRESQRQACEHKSKDHFGVLRWRLSGGDLSKKLLEGAGKVCVVIYWVWLIGAIW